MADPIRDEKGNRVPNTAVRPGSLDRLAIGLSGLCLVHCIASAVLVNSVKPVAGTVTPGDAPGSGIDFDPAAVRRYRVE